MVNQSEIKITRRQKDIAKEMRENILVHYIIDGEIWLHDLEGLSISYFLEVSFERLNGG